MYVYILKSRPYPNQEYIGSTTNLKKRLSQHNRGDQSHTSKNRPWKIKTALWFDDKEKATQFEKYLKSGTGPAFRSNHF